MPRNADMDQVKELLDLIRGVNINGGLVAVSFISCRVQPCKERAHPAFEFKGKTDGTREKPDMLLKEVIEERAAELFTSHVSFNMPGYSKPFNCSNQPPQVNVSALCS